MSLDTQVFLPPTGVGDNIKCFAVKSKPPSLGYLEFVPRIYFEAKIDFCDVRSGFRGTCGVSKAFEIYQVEDDALWTQDMIWDVDPATLELGTPDSGRAHPVPPFVDADFLALMEGQISCYLIRYFAVRIYRNYSLNAYSTPGENLEEFRMRCSEILSEGFRKDLDSLQDLFQRKLEQIREKWLRESEGPAYSRDLEAIKRAAHWKSKLHGLSERLAGLFLNTELGLDLDRVDGHAPRYTAIELDERVQLLEYEARQ